MRERKSFWKKIITYCGLFTTIIMLVILAAPLTAYADRSNWIPNGSRWPDNGGCDFGGIEFYKYSGEDGDLSNVHITRCSDRRVKDNDHITWEGDPRFAYYGYRQSYVGSPPQNVVDTLNRGWLDWRTPSPADPPCRDRFGRGVC